MKPVKIYTKSYCPYCKRAKALLDRKGIKYEEIDIENDSEKAEKLFAQTGFRTVPQVFIGEECIGGSDALHELENRGELDGMLG